MTASKIFLCFCLSFVAGIFLNSLFHFPQLLPIIILILGILLISVLWKFKKFVVLGFCLLFLVTGIWRQQKAESSILNSELRKLNDLNQNITLIGVVSREPDIREKSQKLTFDNLTIKTEKSEDSPLIFKGSILVTTGRYPEYQYGDKLKIMGKLETPQNFAAPSGEPRFEREDFDYQNYLAKEGIFSVMNWPQIELLGQNQGGAFYKTLFSFKNQMEESLNKTMGPPQSALMEALLFGEERNFTQEWKDKLNLTGTRHIAAVSGMNITIITILLLNFLLALGFWRWQAFYFSVILIILYILMLGTPASAVRAGAMGILLLLAQNFGRLASGFRLLVFAVVLMLFQNPLLLMSDVGFQLSFLAVLGLIYFQSWFSYIFRKIPNVLQTRTSLAATLSAQVFTLPILIYNFGRISFISPFTNILIVPLLPLITILGFISSLVGIFWEFLGQILSWPAWLFLTYLIKVIDWFSQIPGAALSAVKIHWFWLIIFYLFLGFIAYKLNKKRGLISFQI